MLPLTGYAACKLMTVRTTYLDAGLTNYPSPAPIVADADMGGRCRADGYDVRFTAVDGVTLLTHHRVSFAIAGGAATAFYWVLVDHTTAPATQIYCHYGKADATDVSDMAGTWTPSYTRSWGLGEAYGTGAGNYKDRCGVGDLTLTDADGDSGQGDGIVGKCVDLNGDADYLTEPDHPDHDPGGAMTAEVWIKFDVLTGNTGYIGHKPAVERWYIRTETSAPRLFHCYVVTASGTTDSGASVTTPSVGIFYYVVMTYDKTLSSNRLKLYLQGLVEKQANGYNEDILETDGGLGICYIRNNYFGGLVAEARFKKGEAKSAAWIKFTRYALTSADGEWTWGAEEMATSIPVIMEHYRKMREA